MIYAQVKDGIVKNTIVLEDENLLLLFKDGFDQVVRIDQLSPKPGIGWSYDGTNFSAPPAPDDSVQP